ncbi:hypothetical protein CYLTODRAFT_426298 [Cylindrobasidium torrendii FP15055 ss-10]|uniref:Uncharacterized protein n=1 Tax=Cylindrobasidium torrendii FP15055 ss-10 TaxID=1314674 RepID=A0A0D7AYB1_9AGAR|nr:hypothetical protein CYLTODRAFT_426298 [Cylindrobasidium torrendii FP15055 ss-10]
MQSICAHHLKAPPPTPAHGIYKDYDGDIHDPDYHHFPALPAVMTNSPGADEDTYVDPFSPSARASPSAPSPSPSSYTSPPSPGGSIRSHKKRRPGLTLRRSYLSLNSLRDGEDGEHEHESSTVSTDFGEDDDIAEEDTAGTTADKHRHPQRSLSADNVKRNIRAMSLSMSVSVFRARKKVQNALHSSDQ